MAVPAEPNAEALANLIQDQGQAQPPVQDQQIQAQEQQPQAPPGAAAAQIQVGEVFRLCSSFIFAALRCASRRFFPCPGLSFCFRSYFRALSLHVYRVFCQVLPFMCHPFTVVAPLAYCCYRVFTLQKAWSCVRPEKEFGRVFDLRKSLVVCSTLERVWSCVRP